MFSCAYWPFVCILWGNVYLNPLPIVWVISFYCWIIRILYIFCMLVPYQIWRNFLPFCGWSFHVLYSVLWNPKVFCFVQVQFIFLFVSCTFGMRSKKPLPSSRSRFHIFFPFLLRVLAFTLGSLIHFELIIVYKFVWSRDPNLFFCVWMSSCPSVICWNVVFLYLIVASSVKTAIGCKCRVFCVCVDSYLSCIEISVSSI